MNSKIFFDFNKELSKKDIIVSLNNSVEVLEDDYDFISKILENEKERMNYFRSKAELMLTIYLAFISTLLGSSLLGIFSETLTTDDGIIFIFGGGIFIAIVSIIGITQLVLIIHPKMLYVVDPMIVIKKHNSKIDWLKEAIADSLYVYRNNLPRIGLASYRIRTSIDCLILGVSATIFIILYYIFASFLLANLDKAIYIVLGLVIGLVFLSIALYQIMFKPRSYGFKHEK